MIDFNDLLRLALIVTTITVVVAIIAVSSIIINNVDNATVNHAIDQQKNTQIVLSIISMINVFVTVIIATILVHWIINSVGRSHFETTKDI